MKSKIKKEYAAQVLKEWADKNFVMIKERSWQENAYFPDSSNTLGTLVGAINGKDDFYFDDNEFVRGDKTIFVVKPEITKTRDLYNELVKMGII